MKKLFLLSFLALILGACSQPTNVTLSDDEINTKVAIVVAMTQDSYTPTPEPTDTPVFTNTPKPTNTQRPTSTPRPTRSPTPKPSFDNSPKTQEDSFIMTDQYVFNFPTITITAVYTQSQFVVIWMEIENSGGIGEYGYHNFVAVDSNGIFIDPEIFTGLDCALDFSVSVMDGATLDKCIAFEIPSPTTFTLMYAPYQNDPYNPERSLQWEISIK